MKTSLIDVLKEAQETSQKNGDKHTAHFIVGVDMTEDKGPQGSLMIAAGTPFETVGMIDLLILNLQDTKKDILKQLSTKEQKNMRHDVSELIDSLPKGVREKVLDIKRRMEEAAENNDHEQLKAIQQEVMDLKNPFSKTDEDDDEDNFNINDFKGGMA